MDEIAVRGVDLEDIEGFERACAQAAEWRRAGLPPIPIAVNVSGVQFHRQDLREVVRSKLDAFGLDPSVLHIEITETAIVAARERAIELLGQLRELGVHLALDDFGTGYSSLAQLKRLPVREIKVDRSFVIEMMQSPDVRQIVRSTIDLGHNLGMRVVGEGVESGEALAVLRELGCDLAQGHFVSPPLPGPEFVRWLRERGRTGSAA